MLPVPAIAAAVRRTFLRDALISVRRSAAATAAARAAAAAATQGIPVDAAERAAEDVAAFASVASTGGSHYVAPAAIGLLAASPLSAVVGRCRGVAARAAAAAAAARGAAAASHEPSAAAAAARGAATADLASRDAIATGGTRAVAAAAVTTTGASPAAAEAGRMTVKEVCTRAVRRWCRRGHYVARREEVSSNKGAFSDQLPHACYATDAAAAAGAIKAVTISTPASSGSVSTASTAVKSSVQLAAAVDSKGTPLAAATLTTAAAGGLCNSSCISITAAAGFRRNNPSTRAVVNRAATAAPLHTSSTIERVCRRSSCRVCGITNDSSSSGRGRSCSKGLKTKGASRTPATQCCNISSGCSRQDPPYNNNCSGTFKGSNGSSSRGKASLQQEQEEQFVLLQEERNQAKKATARSERRRLAENCHNETCSSSSCSREACSSSNVCGNNPCNAYSSSQPRSSRRGVCSSIIRHSSARCVGSRARSGSSSASCGSSSSSLWDSRSSRRSIRRDAGSSSNYSSSSRCRRGSSCNKTNIICRRRSSSSAPSLFPDCDASGSRSWRRVSHDKTVHTAVNINSSSNPTSSTRSSSSSRSSSSGSSSTNRNSSSRSSRTDSIWQYGVRPRDCWWNSSSAFVFSKVAGTRQFSSTAAAGQEDFYDVLGVKKNATAEDIKRAYREQALRWHPDRNAEKRKEAEEKFRQISEAYQTLSNTERRRQYDNASRWGGGGSSRGSAGRRAAAGDSSHFSSYNPFEGEYHQQHVTQEEAERLFREVFDGMSVQQLLRRVVQQQSPFDGRRGGVPFFDEQKLEEILRSGGVGGLGPDIPGTWSAQSSSSSGDGSIGTTRTVNVLRRHDGKYIERVIITKRYPGGRVEKEVSEHELPSKSHPHQETSSSFFHPFFGSSTFFHPGHPPLQQLLDALFAQHQLRAQQQQEQQQQQQQQEKQEAEGGRGGRRGRIGATHDGVGRASRAPPRSSSSSSFTKQQRQPSPSSLKTIVPAGIWAATKRFARATAAVVVLNVKLWLVEIGLRAITRFFLRLFRRR